jgi:hypothetical protein
MRRPSLRGGCDELPALRLLHRQGRGVFCRPRDPRWLGGEQHFGIPKAYPPAQRIGDKAYGGIFIERPTGYICQISE